MTARSRFSIQFSIHEAKEVKTVSFEEDDPEDPKNWPTRRKVLIVLNLCILSFASVFGSSVYAPAEAQAMELFHINAEVASLGLSLYVLGFAFGPLLCPMSEMYGRRLPYLISWPLLIGCVAPSAWVNNLAVILVFRFLTGATAACALNNGAGILADLYGSKPHLLMQTIGWYFFAPLCGPIAASIVGFFVAAHTGKGFWVIRVFWFLVIALWPLVFFVPETHGPTILLWRAKRLRREGATEYYAAQELEKTSVKQMLAKHIGRPIAMMIYEPINQGAAAWISLVYGIVYFYFETFPIVFVKQNHIPFQFGGLPFIGIIIGLFILGFSFPYLVQNVEKIKLPFIEPPGGISANSPEAQVKVALLGCALIPISLFWFAWTSAGNVHWISPTLAGIPFGAGVFSVFYSFASYTAQTYLIYATSAQASNTLVRSVFASILPIIATPIVNQIGTEWGVSIFGFLSLGLLPIPIVFIRYGAQLREHSRFGREARAIIQAIRTRQEDVPIASDKEPEGISGSTNISEISASSVDVMMPVVV